MLLEGGRALCVSGLTVMEVSVGAGELGSSAGGSLEQEGQAAVSTSGVSASEDMTDEVSVSAGRREAREGERSGGCYAADRVGRTSQKSAG